MVVGAGGTGSIFMSHLCRIWQAWTKLGGTPFDIELWDMDVVSEANLARQCFCEADIGRHKATVLAHRLRAFYGLPIEAHTSDITSAGMALGYNYSYPSAMDGGRKGVVYIGCVDNLAARRHLRAVTTQTQFGKPLRKDMPQSYWLDFGNSANSGQVILGGHGLPDFFDVFPRLMNAKDQTDVPSCSMAEALDKQDLFINSTVATLGGQLLWQLMRRGGLSHHGYFVNLNSGSVRPLPVPKPKK